MIIDNLKPNPKNPRTISKGEFEKLKNKIKAFPQMLEKRPIVYVGDIVLGGNQRLRAVKELMQEGFKVKDSYFSDASDWTEEQKQQFIITDNISDGEWDMDMIANEWSGLPLEEWGMNPADWDKGGLSDEYSQKLGEVIYEPKETNHKISDLFQKETKFDKAINSIANEELREMLKMRASYFTNFNYAKIADYYAYQAKPEEQRIMERLGFVLLDKDKLIEHGFSKLIDEVTEEDEVYDDSEK